MPLGTERWRVVAFLRHRAVQHRLSGSFLFLLDHVPRLFFWLVLKQRVRDWKARKISEMLSFPMPMKRLQWTHYRIVRLPVCGWSWTSASSLWAIRRFMQIHLVFFFFLATFSLQSVGPELQQLAGNCWRSANFRENTTQLRHKPNLCINTAVLMPSKRKYEWLMFLRSHFLKNADCNGA